MRFVVGVAGAPGSGKSSLVAALAGPRALALRMDDYENMTRLPLDEVARWYRAGGHIDAFAFPRLQADLERLKQDAADGLLLFETQFGRAHHATGRHIDFLVWIDTPLDIALARTLRATVARGLRGADAEGLMRWTHGYLEAYLGTVRELLEMQKARVAPAADLVVDGRGPVAEVADAVRAALRA